LAKEMQDQHLPISKLLFVVAAGDDGLPMSEVPERLFFAKSFDAAGVLDSNVVGVGAIDKTGAVWVRSNWGVKYVQLLAPAVDVFSTAGNNDYAEGTGTSFA